MTRQWLTLWTITIPSEHGRADFELCSRGRGGRGRGILCTKREYLSHWTSSPRANFLGRHVTLGQDVMETTPFSVATEVELLKTKLLRFKS